MNHEYVSTACQHLLCPQGGIEPEKSMCIASCKYCDTPCGCACHAGETAPEGRLYQTIYEALAGSGLPVPVHEVVEVMLAALLNMPRTMPDRAADRLEKWLASDRPDATIFRQSGHLAVDLHVLINEFRNLREEEPK